MARVKRGKIARKRRKYLLKYTKGFRWGRKSKYRAAKEALLHAWTYAFKGRKIKKRSFRRLWQQQISAALKEHGISYNKFIHALKNKKIEIDRKILTQLAQNHPRIFQELVDQAKKNL